MADEKNPLLVAYDAKLHQVTEKHRTEHKEFWFKSATAHFKGRSEGQQPVAAESTAPVHPALAAYRKDLDAVTVEFNQANLGYLFWHTGSKITPLSKVVKADSISHDTKVVRPGAAS